LPFSFVFTRLLLYNVIGEHSTQIYRPLFREFHYFMSEQSPFSTDNRAASSYRWIIVATCALMIFITYGLVYSYSIFFKPLADYFHWDRATVSLIYSAAVIIRGASAIGTGWLADRYGARRVMVFCGFMMGAGFLLSSRVASLWQFFLTYAVIEAIGMSGIFGIGTAMVSRWFTKNRGLALGIVASGSGLGTMLIAPGTEQLINAVDWSQTFIIIGIGAGVLMVAAALFLRKPPFSLSPAVKDAEEFSGSRDSQPDGISLAEALRDRRMLLILITFLLFFFSIQMVMVHLVNYATDMGIDPLVAATFVSVIGAVSIGGRLSIGVGADRIGVYSSLLVTRVFLVLSFVLLLFTRAPWSFYLFAVLFGIPYGGEVTQIPLVIGRYFGTGAMATLMGVTMFTNGLGGALGPWVAGKIFDITGSYNGAFITGAVVALGSTLVVFLLKREDSRNIHATVR
jgi:MFS family permease